ncbi:MAG: hypothetical protein JWP75_1135 [Frondihabitans sp.]|nr:hypothetical protein [Frondihabitans sp.]
MSLNALTPEADAVRDARRPGVVHLGLGAFHRSHQAWFTQRIAPDRDPWGIIAFTGRRPDAATALAEQNCVYTVIERSADGDTASLIDAVIEAHDGADALRWREAVSDDRVAVITLTVTEAAYLRTRDGVVDLHTSAVASDVARLREGAADACTTVPGRLVDGLRARRDTGSGPVAVLCCDNLTDNGAVVRGVVTSLASAVDDELAAWITDNVSFVSSMVDRITPATTDDDRATALTLTGYDDHAVVVAEPFAEWVVSGAFPAGRPAWETAGVRFVDDLEPYEQRKLWLLNAGHSLLAYLGLLFGHETVDEAMADPRCAEPLEALWDEAAAVLPLPAAEIGDACASLRDRFRNPRIRHRLRQIAADGSVKLPVRVVDPVRLHLAAGEPIGDGAATALAAWWLHLTEQPSLVNDEGATALGASCSVDDVLRVLAPDLAGRPTLGAAVSAAADRVLDLLSPSTMNTAIAPTGATA